MMIGTVQASMCMILHVVTSHTARPGTINMWVDVVYDVFGVVK
jgi:hypothetical protein